jgi:hypothetical protein
MDHTARLDGLLHECVQALGGGVWYLLQPDASNALPVLFSRYGYQGLLLHQPAAQTLL